MPIFLRPLFACLALLALTACSAQKSNPEPPLAVAGVAEPGAKVEVEPDVAAESNPQTKETCYGVLDCTFFGVGAVLAAPFWVLGAFLGLVF